ncbi:MAG: type II secretion system protein N [Hydrogenophaga sp.]|jgi:general secretion pathway protein C|uniref:type II secretion system protein N n=1 Tax=Hydrogenophaga sp. TaxID=1904254 RepID=UPI002618D1FE|nr:type II secretion system protein N [Hydrogenophaga sp.]MDD3785961.1 type II secretion system protein N [Hydrogenophaga sp.]MDX9969700.1 type II secretion system protein N [Hydrogenophaga sp.]
MTLQTPSRHPGALVARVGHAPLWAAGLIWLAAGAALTGWLLILLSGTAWQPVPVAAGTAVAVEPVAVARALGLDGSPGAAGPAADTGARLRLAGVVAQPDARGAALIAVDGQPPRPFLVGSAVGDGWVLRAVERRRVWLSPTTGETGDLELQLQR